MKAKLSIVIFLTFALSLCHGYTQPQLRDIRTHPNPYEIYQQALRDTLPRLEPLFVEWEDARSKGDKVKQLEIHRRIALTNTLEDWRWTFYQYGANNFAALSPKEQEAWKLVDKSLAGKQKPSPEDLLLLDPPQIRENLVRERKLFGIQDRDDAGNGESKESDKLPARPSPVIVKPCVPPQQPSSVLQNTPTQIPVAQSTPQVSPAKAELLTPKETSSNRGLLLSLTAIVLSGAGFVLYRNRKR